MGDRSFPLPGATRRAILTGVGGSVVAAALPARAAPEVEVETITLSLPDGRRVAVELISPAGSRPLDAIVFSHGANASPDRYRALTSYWAGRGFLVLSPLHIDSEIHPARETKNRGLILRTRLADMDTIRDGLSARTLLPAALAARLGARPPIAAGHSYGAYVAQIMGGATVMDPDGGPRLLTSAARAPVAAIVALSPPPAADGFSPARSWATVNIPMLVETGTTDILPPFAARWEQHLDSLHAAPPALAWGAVYDGIDHYFNGVICRPRPDADARSRAQLARFAELSVAFIGYARKATPAAHAAFARQLAKLSDQALPAATAAT